MEWNRNSFFPTTFNWIPCCILKELKKKKSNWLWYLICFPLRGRKLEWGLRLKSIIAEIGYKENIIKKIIIYKLWLPFSNIVGFVLFISLFTLFSMLSEYSRPWLFTYSLEFFWSLGYSMTFSESFWILCTILWMPISRKLALGNT